MTQQKHGIRAGPEIKLLKSYKMYLVNEILQNVSKVVSLGRRNATVPEGYSIDQKAEEESGRLEQHVVGTKHFSTLFYSFFKWETF